LGLAPDSFSSRANLDHRRDSRRIVHRPVVEGVAVDGATDADVIEVRRHDDEFFSQAGIGTVIDPDDVLGIDRHAFHGRLRAQCDRKDKARQRFLVGDQSIELAERMTASVQELLRAPSCEHQGHHLSGLILQIAIGEDDRPLRHLCAAAPGSGALLG
jgi:hypothetical protein